MSMAFNEFQAKQFPESSVFERKQFNFHTNLVKWVALKIAYILFRMGLTANVIDLLALLGSFVGFSLILYSTGHSPAWAFLGVVLIYSHIFIDFVDGPIAKARGDAGPIGAALDDVGCEVDRAAMIIVLALLAEGSAYYVLAASFAAGFYMYFFPRTVDEISKRDLPNLMLKLYTNKYSFLSVRFMLVGLPLLIAATIFLNGDAGSLATVLSAIYITLAFVWLLICIPNYKKGE